MPRRVVITGLGILAPGAIGTERFWSLLAEGLLHVSRLVAVVFVSIVPGFFIDKCESSLSSFMELEKRVYAGPLARAVEPSAPYAWGILPQGRSVQPGPPSGYTV